MSDANHESRGPAKSPRKPPDASTAPAEPKDNKDAKETKKKAADKSDTAASSTGKSKIQAKKPLKGKSGSDADRDAAVEDSRETKLAAKDAPEKSDGAKSARDAGASHGSKADLHSSKADPHTGRDADAGGKTKRDKRADSKHDAKADSRGALADHDDDQDPPTPAPRDDDDDPADDDSKDESDDKSDRKADSKEDAALAAAEAAANDLPELPDLPDVAPNEDERFHAMCAWLSAAALILAMVCPLYFVGPLLYFLRYRRRSRFVAFHAKQGMYWSFGATGLIWSVLFASSWILGSISGLQYAGFSLVVIVPVQVTIIIWFLWIGLKALHGVKYQTPIIGRMAESSPQKFL